MAKTLKLVLTAGDSWFDLAELLEATGGWPDLSWVLYDIQMTGDVTDIWPNGVEGVEEPSASSDGLPLSWFELKALAERADQVVWGSFVGRDRAGSTVIHLSVVDSSFWLVHAPDAGLLTRLSEHFSEVETSTESGEPQPRYPFWPASHE